MKLVYDLEQLHKSPMGEMRWLLIRSFGTEREALLERKRRDERGGHYGLRVSTRGVAADEDAMTVQ